MSATIIRLYDAAIIEPVDPFTIPAPPPPMVEPNLRPFRPWPAVTATIGLGSLAYLIRSIATASLTAFAPALPLAIAIGLVLGLAAIRAVVMTALTVPAVLAMIAAHNCVPPSVASIMVGIAQHESGLDPAALHRNPNGTLDVGIAQINTSNFGWLGLTMQTALDPCRNLAAGAAVLFAKYNGSAPDAVRKAYAADVTARIARVGAASSIPASAPSAPQEEAAIDDRPADPTGETIFHGD